MKRGQKQPKYITLLKKWGLLPKKKPASNSSSYEKQSSTATTTTRKIEPKSQNSQQSSHNSTYSIGGDQNIEEELTKKKNKAADKANKAHNKGKEKRAMEREMAEHLKVVKDDESPEEKEQELEFEITGDIRSTKQPDLMDDFDDTVVPYSALESVMEEADHEHSTLQNVIKLVSRVSSKRYAVPYDDLCSPREQCEEAKQSKKLKEYADTATATATASTITSGSLVGGSCEVLEFSRQNSDADEENV
jgi:prophage DNA circulation protein